MDRVRLPSLRGIETFASVAETLSFRRAAERLHITVSAVSHRISALEDEIGARLFDRGARPLKLTATGVAYRDRLLPLLIELGRVADRIDTEENSPLIRIASFQMFHAQWLLPRVAPFLDMHPEARFEFVTLRHRKTICPDVTIRIIRSEDVGAEDEHLFGWAICPVALPDFVKRHDIRTRQDLLKAPLVTSSAAPASWSTWMKAAGITPQPVSHPMLVDAPSLAYDIAAQGLAACLTSTSALGYCRSRGLVPLFDITARYPGSVYINRPAANERPIVRAFRKWLLQEIAVTEEGQALLPMPGDADMLEDIGTT